MSVGLAYTPAALLALFAPKCPLCLGALLAVLGVSVALPSYSYALVVMVSVALGTLALVWRFRFSPRRRAAMHETGRRRG